MRVAAPDDVATVTVIQRNGQEVVLTVKEARKFAFKLLTAAANVERDYINAQPRAGKGAA